MAHERDLRDRRDPRRSELQPRLSRLLKLRVEAGLLLDAPEGASARFQVASDADLARRTLGGLPEDDTLLPGGVAARPSNRAMRQPPTSP